MFRSFLLGMLEMRLTYTTRPASAAHAEAYELGRAWAHKLTFHHFDPN